ncbi:MAG: hypothetical protein JWL97_4125, partial [Gemmatimonadales bacterium]|nr:hypothetical protein [Gemmatimonadales bacterium]
MLLSGLSEACPTVCFVIGTFSDGSDARAMALEAERQRLAAKQARRAGAIPSADLAAWHTVGVAADAVANVRHVLRELLAVAGPAAVAVEYESIRACLQAGPDPGLGRTVAQLLRTLPGERTAEFLRDLQEVGLPLISADQLRTVRILAQPDDTADQLQEARSVDEEPQWRLFADTLAVSRGLEPAERRVFVEKAPLAAVDQYLERSKEGISSAWWRKRPVGERRYLTARTEPDQLTVDMVQALDWREELHRRRLSSGLGYEPEEGEERIELFDLLVAAGAGNTEVLDRLAALLPSENAAVVSAVRTGALLASWSPQVQDDRGLWMLLIRAWAPDDIIDPERSPFHKWAAWRRCYDLTLAGRFGQAWVQTQMFPMGGKPTAPIDKEIQNLRAYLTLVRDDLDEIKALNQAGALLQALAPHPIAKANYEWVRRRRNLTRNERGLGENPYLHLEVDHGAPTGVWKAAWRRLRKQHGDDIDLLSSINKAKDLIQALEYEAVDGRAQVFIIPLDPKRLNPQNGKPWKLLVPAARPLPRCTEDVAWQTILDPLRSAAV